MMTLGKAAARDRLIAFGGQHQVEPRRFYRRAQTPLSDYDLWDKDYRKIPQEDRAEFIERLGKIGSRLRAER
jgi:hypothetical protein